MMDKPVNPLRRKQIARAMLEALSMAGGYALEESILFSCVDDLVKPPLTFTEKGQAAHNLKEAGWMRLVPDSMDAGLKQWVITELGRNTLASL